MTESSYPEELNPPEQIYYPSQNNDRQVVLNNSATCKIFKKVVCCGDSYTSGYIDVTPDGEEKTSETFSETNEEYSWVHYMSQMTGNKVNVVDVKQKDNSEKSNTNTSRSHDNNNNNPIDNR